MALVDTHTHLESFAHKGQLPEILSRAREAGLEAIVTIGTGPDDWDLYRGISRDNPGFVYYTAGLHPCAVGERWSEDLISLESFFEHETAPVGLGETGLDRFHLPKDDPAAAERIFRWQRSAFAVQLELARRLDCPLVVHSRGAFAECVQMIDASGVDWSRVVFHCFTESEADMKELVSRGGYGSFTGVLTYKSADNVRAAARLQGLSRFMLETDAPYLTPMPHRGKPNEPAYLLHTAEFAANIFEVSYEELAATSTAMARRFYRLP